jgi:hypothetical protein
MADHAEGRGTVPPSRLTRRRVVAGVAAAAAADALGTARRALAQTGQALDEPDLRAAAVPSPVPAVDPASPLWEQARAVEVALVGQAVAIPTKMTPAVPSITVRALHDGKIVAFRLQWKDTRRDALTVKTTQFRDSCAVFLGPHPASGDLWFMGAADRPVTLLHWRADWQLDIEAGFQDLEAAFPNAAFDFYPPLVGAKHPLKLPDAYPPGARGWLPGWRAGNPLSQPLKSTPVEKLGARGPGTVTSFANQDALGKGIWRNGAWTVVLAKSLRSTDEKEILLRPGGRYALAFAVWSGGEGDVGARKSVTRLGRLHLEGG